MTSALQGALAMSIAKQFDTRQEFESSRAKIQQNPLLIGLGQVIRDAHLDALNRAKRLAVIRDATARKGFRWVLESETAESEVVAFIDLYGFQFTELTNDTEREVFAHHEGKLHFESRPRMRKRTGEKRFCIIQPRRHGWNLILTDQSGRISVAVPLTSTITDEDRKNFIAIQAEDGSREVHLVLHGDKAKAFGARIGFSDLHDYMRSATDFDFLLKEMKRHSFDLPIYQVPTSTKGRMMFAKAHARRIASGEFHPFELRMADGHCGIQNPDWAVIPSYSDQLGGVGDEVHI